MNRRLHSRTVLTLAFAILCAAWLAEAVRIEAQTASRFLGSITAINGNTLTVKTDAGDQRQVDVPAEASIKRIAPGEKDLSKAASITFADLAIGDRVLVKIDPNATGANTQAAQIIAVKQEDLAQKQQKDREDWQRRGVAGLVKSVDTGAGIIVLTTGAGATAKNVTVHTAKATVLKRYAPGSVRFDQAQPASIDAIHPGDQLRARGEKSAEGSEVTADEVVSGSFRNISGTIASLDAASSTLVVKDLATKKTVTIRITAEAQMRRLPERMAQMLAMRLKGGNAGAPGPPPAMDASASGTPKQPPPGGPPQHAWNGGNGPGAGGPGGPGGPGAGGGGQSMGQNGDLQQMLSRAPTIQFADLLKGEAIMLVSTDGASDVTAITLLAGVEPLLQAPAASQNLLSNWSMGSGGGAEGAAATP